MYQGEGAEPPPVLAGGGQGPLSAPTFPHPPPKLQSPPFPLLAILGSEKGNVIEPESCL